MAHAYLCNKAACSARVPQNLKYNDNNKKRGFSPSVIPADKQETDVVCMAVLKVSAHPESACVLGLSSTRQEALRSSRALPTNACNPHYHQARHFSFLLFIFGVGV